MKTRYLGKSRNIDSLCIFFHPARIQLTAIDGSKGRDVPSPEIIAFTKQHLLAIPGENWNGLWKAWRF